MDTIQSILNAMMREAVSPQTAALVIAVIGLNIHFGFTGLLNIGQSGFMLLGAYGFGISISKYALPLPVAILIGFAAAGIFALVLGIPTLKLRGDYLAIVTISAAEIIRYVGRSTKLDSFTGASQGLQGKTYRDPFVDLSPFGGGETVISQFNYLDVAGGAWYVRVIGWALMIAMIVAIVKLARRTVPVTGAARVVAMVVLSAITTFGFFFLFPLDYFDTGVSGWWVRLVAWALVLVCTLVVFLLVRSPWGRLLRGVREDEDAIRSLGKNVFAIKMQALVIGGLLGGLGGMLYVLPSAVQPDALGRTITFYAYTGLLLGGAATIFGPILGTVLFFSARIGIRSIAAAYVPDSVMSNQQAEQFSLIVVGVALMLIVIFRPQGILGDKRELRFNV